MNPFGNAVMGPVAAQQPVEGQGFIEFAEMPLRGPLCAAVVMAFLAVQSHVARLDRSGLRRASAGDVRIALGSAGPQQATSASQWALPCRPTPATWESQWALHRTSTGEVPAGLNQGRPGRSGHC